MMVLFFVWMDPETAHLFAASGVSYQVSVCSSKLISINNQLLQMKKQSGYILINLNCVDVLADWILSLLRMQL